MSIQATTGAGPAIARPGPKLEEFTNRLSDVLTALRGQITRLRGITDRLHGPVPYPEDQPRECKDGALGLMFNKMEMLEDLLTDLNNQVESLESVI